MICVFFIFGVYIIITGVVFTFCFFSYSLSVVFFLFSIHELVVIIVVVDIIIKVFVVVLFIVVMMIVVIIILVVL